MYRILLAILLAVSTFAVVAHGILVYQLSATESIIAEEETSEGKPFLKKAKEISKENIGYALLLCRQTSLGTLCKAILEMGARCSKGFYNTPYNPPDAI